MLTQIKLTNFKRFTEETTFPLSNFNLLTGVNGSGKSTLLQVLLLINQSSGNRFVLNGKHVELGNANDVISIRGKPICFEFESEFIYEDHDYDSEEPCDKYLTTQKIHYELVPDSDGLLIEKIVLRVLFVNDKTRNRTDIEPIKFFRSRDEEGNDCYRTDKEGYSMYLNLIDFLYPNLEETLLYGEEVVVFYLRGLYPEELLEGPPPDFPFSDQATICGKTRFVSAENGHLINWINTINLQMYVHTIIEMNVCNLL